MDRPSPSALLDSFRDALERARTPDDLVEVNRLHLGKKSPLKGALKSLGRLAPAERPEAARALNEARSLMEQEFEARREHLERRAVEAQLAAEWHDLTLPGVAPERGMRHPVTQTEERLLALMRRLGFSLVDGPEIEHPYYNFDALNIPEHHPARDLQDTFWVDGRLLLRSHTTTVQARVLQKQPELPIRVVSAGRVYRNEAVDATHLAMFHQFEGIWVDRGLTFAHLKGTLALIARELYGDQHRIRFKPKFYPYTEPSVGVDLSCAVCGGPGCAACHGAGWVTILGAGMIHPKVFREFGYDPHEVTGIAFGIGTTRLAAQEVGITRVRSLYELDLRVHRAIHRGEP
ncbi:MAG: phenylalanine--tRNA ligase subunit alpha [Deltaproteobacteria bacterium]|nr:MAG: phenylalanine--tRNA ligase subunit alpha [Deltaproteobacteria bacterium]